jgi:hypothetical protein
MKSNHLKIAVALIILFNLFGTGASTRSGTIAAAPLGVGSVDRALPVTQSNDHHLYLPVLFSPLRQSPRINLPYFEDQVRYPETAIFWFGQVTPTENYADVRLGYTDQELFVHLTLFDRRLWYDLSPTMGTLTDWDAVTLYLNLTGSQGDAPSTDKPTALSPSSTGGSRARIGRQFTRAMVRAGRSLASLSPPPAAGAALPPTMTPMTAAGPWASASPLRAWV